MTCDTKKAFDALSHRNEYHTVVLDELTVDEGIIEGFHLKNQQGKIINQTHVQLGKTCVLVESQESAQEPDEFPGCPEGCTCEGEF